MVELQKRDGLIGCIAVSRPFWDWGSLSKTGDTNKLEPETLQDTKIENPSKSP